MKNSLEHKIINATDIFSSYALDSKAIYLYCFGKIPNILFINHLDGEKAFKEFKVLYASQIQSEYHYRQLQRKQKKTDFNESIVLLNNNCLLTFDESYCRILYDYHDSPFAQSLAEFITKFSERKK